MEPIHILIADDHPNVRAQIRARLSRESCFQVVAEAANSAEAVTRTLESKPQILLIDPMMRDGLGIHAVRRIAASVPMTIIVVLTAAADTAFAMELRKAGVQRVLDKGIASQELIDLLLKVGRADFENKSSDKGVNEWK